MIPRKHSKSRIAMRPRLRRFQAVHDVSLHTYRERRKSVIRQFLEVQLVYFAALLLLLLLFVVISNVVVVVDAFQPTSSTTSITRIPSCATGTSCSRSSSRLPTIKSIASSCRATSFMTRVLFLTTNDDSVDAGDPLSASSSSIIDRHHNSNDNNNGDEDEDEEDGDGDGDGNDGLKIAIVGTGPSGLLLAHLLLHERKGKGIGHHKITLFDGRSDPRSTSTTNQGRAYALGLGIRGRTAIRTVDEELWQTIKGRGYESERFRLHVTLPFLPKDVVIPLRSEPTEQEDTVVVEPSLLIYQSELCAGLLDELERRHLTSSVATTAATTQVSSSSKKQQQQQKQKLDIHFNTQILDCDFESMALATTQHKHAHKHDDAATTTTTENNSSSDAIDTTTTTAAAASNTNTNTNTTTKTNTSSLFGPFDLIVGCDGVNSRVRHSIQDSFGPAFQTTKERLPGLFKVVRLNDAINNNVYDPTAVSLLLPSGAFIEPTSQDGSCCILFSGRDNESESGNGNNGNSKHLPIYLTDTTNKTAVIESLSRTFPQWRNECYDDIAKQLMRTTTTRTTTTSTTANSTTTTVSSSYSVTCNTYHYQDKAVLVGDAAHATGGVSGQGVNSALVDAVVLADCIQQQQQPHNVTTGTLTLHEALLEYSIRQVPEGQALYELSFGPKPQGFISKGRWIMKNIRDALFRGRFKVFGIQVGEMPLQTRLSSELTPFVDIRREREEFYSSTSTSTNTNNNVSSFPSDPEFREQLSVLHERSNSAVKKEQNDIT